MARTSKKDSVLRFRLPSDIKDTFLLWCHSQGVAPSLALRSFILQATGAPAEKPIEKPHTVAVNPEVSTPRPGATSDIANLTDF